jgi:hypothetical protein
MEPLTFKIITDADDSGVRRYEKSLGGVDTTGRKASGAVRDFVNQLGQAQNATDVASAALSAFTKIIGTSVGATAVVIVGKALVDAFNKVNDAVKQSTKSVEQANKEIAKIAMAGPSFETASKQADVLNKTAEELRKNLEKINESKLQSFIAGLIGSREKMEELIATTKKQADEATKQAIVQKLIELERNDVLDDTTKKIAEQQKPYQELLVLARAINSTELLRAVEQASQAKQRRTLTEEQAKLDAKTIEDRKKAEEERIKELQKLEEAAAAQRAKIFEAEEKAREDAYKIEAKFMADLQAKERERLDEITKQLSSIEERKQAIRDEIDLLLQRNAAEAAGFGGTGRGPEQRPTSFETGLEQQLLRERYKAIQERDREYFDFIREQLKSQGKAYDKWAIQSEIARRATKEQKDEILKANEEIRELKKEFKKLADESKQLEKEASRLENSLKAARKNLDAWGKGLFDFAKDFTISSRNMIGESLGAAAGLNSLGDVSNMVSSFLGEAGSAADAMASSLSSAGDAAASFASKLAGGEEAGADAAGALATEATLFQVLQELRENLKEIRSYAHAT